MVYKTLPHYRLAFFEQLRARLQEDGIVLRLLVGQPDRVHALKADTGTLEWAELAPSRFISVRGRTLVWQSVIRRLRTTDLVIVEQASRLLVNNMLIGWRRLGGPRLALWGHGENLDRARASRLGERWKRALITECDWWFAYTASTEMALLASGVPSHMITVVQNSTDTLSLRRRTAGRHDEVVDAARAELGLQGEHVALVLGSIYPLKRPQFIIEVADAVRARVSDFELLVIGDGPDRALIDDAARSRPWMRVLGAQMGARLALLASPAQMIINPGPVGLTIVDGFALGLPLLTCDLDSHGPEIDYLENRQNGLVIPQADGVDGFADAVVDLLSDGALLERLQRRCLDDAQRYTVENMVENFRAGVLRCLEES